MTHRAVRTGLLLGALVVPGALGVTTTAVALPELSQTVGLSGSRATWLITAYVLAQAVGCAIFGRLTDVRGARPVVLSGAALVAIGSSLAVAGDTFLALLVGRLLQGAGGAALLVTGFAVCGARPDGPERVAVLAVLTTCLGVISGSGPLLGGLLTDAVSWRAVFGVPALALAAVAAVARVAPPATAAAGRLDPVGAALVALAVCMMLVLLSGTASGWAAPVGTLAAASAALVHRIRTVPDGFLPSAVVTSRRYLCGTLVGLTLFAGYLAMVFAAPLLLEQQHAWSPTTIGLILSPAALASVVAAPVVARLLPTRDPYRLTAALAALSAAGLLLGAVAAGAVLGTVVALAMVLAALTGGQAALVDQVPLTVDPALRSVATGLFSLVFMVGGALGTATVVGLTERLGVETAVAVASVLPGAGIGFALAAGTSFVTVQMSASTTEKEQQCPTA